MENIVVIIAVAIPLIGVIYLSEYIINKYFQNKPKLTTLPGLINEPTIWRVVGSSAKFKITGSGKEVYIDGWDYIDGEKFEIFYQKWHARRKILEITFCTPSTSIITTSILKLVDERTLISLTKNLPTGKREKWKLVSSHQPLTNI